MKGNNGQGNNSLRDGWQTPQELFDALDQQYNFLFDCCASEEDKKCWDQKKTIDLRRCWRGWKWLRF